jgi:1,2-diacylglycerol 3-alpha-glucosyltransferase
MKSSMKMRKAIYALIAFVFLIIAVCLHSWTTLTFFGQATSLAISVQKKRNHPLVIFMVTNNYTPYCGGVVTTIDSYSQELRKQGHKVIIITLDFIGASQKKEPDVIRLWCPIRFKYAQNHMAIPWVPEKKLYRLAQQYKPDIIHTFHPFLLGACALKVAKQLQIPSVFTYMTLYNRYLHYIPLPRAITGPITDLIVKNFCSQIDALTAPSGSATEAIKAQGISKPVSIIPLSILPIFEPSTFYPKDHQRHKRLSLVTVSRFSFEKNIFFLLDVYKKLDTKTYKLILIGFGSYLEKLKEYAYQTLQLSPHDVKFIIRPSKDVIKQWYKKAHLFIFASQTETQGLVLAEAMSQGTPVIALEGPGSVDIVENGVNGFLVKSQEEMAQKITYLKHHKFIYNSFQENAFETAQHYTSGTCVHKLLDLYYSLL